MRFDTNPETFQLKYLTDKLWMKYMEMVNIMRAIIRYEEIGEWSLYQGTPQEMLTCLTAYCHLYRVPIPLRVPKPGWMTCIPMFTWQFTQGEHVVRRTNQFWAGLSAYLVIEQVLTRNLKTSDGLTRGTSMTELHRLVWYLPRPACTKVNNAMQQLTPVTYQASEQHKDVSQAEQTRGTVDSEKLMSFIEWRSPFDAYPSFRNIVSSMTYIPEVNVDHANKIRVAILHKWVGHPVFFQEESQSYNY